MKALLDTCVIIDTLQNREPFSQESRQIFLEIADKKAEGYITAKSVTDIFYITHRGTHDGGKTKEIIAKLFSLFHVIDTTESDCKNALFSEISDYEDAVMTESAKRSGMDYIVTRNEKDYKNSPVPIASPFRFLEILHCGE